MNEGCGRKIKSKSPERWAAIADTLRTLEKTRPTAELKTLKELVKSHPIDYPCCTIVHGDCTKHLLNLPDQCFDLCITDPPYGMNFKGKQKHHGRIDWDSNYPVWDAIRMIELARLASYFFCRWDNLKENLTLPKPKSMLVWHKVGGGGGTGNCLHEHTRDYEMAYFYPAPEHKFKHRPKSVLRYKASGNPAHPTQKPVELIKEIMGWYDFDTVLDPYMGSGTTALAAKELGKHFLGFERNKTYYKRAIHRIADSTGLYQ